MKKVVWLVVGVMLVGLWVGVAPSVASRKAGGAKRKILLSGDAINGVVPKGTAEYHVLKKKKKQQRKFEVEAEHVNLPAGTVLTVLVNDAPVGTLTLDRKGEGKLELESSRGDTVPAIQTGDRVTVVDADSNTLLSGQF